MSLFTYLSKLEQKKSTHDNGHMENSSVWPTLSRQQMCWNYNLRVSALGALNSIHGLPSLPLFLPLPVYFFHTELLSTAQFVSPLLATPPSSTPRCPNFSHFLWRQAPLGLPAYSACRAQRTSHLLLHCGTEAPPDWCPPESPGVSVRTAAPGLGPGFLLPLFPGSCPSACLLALHVHEDRVFLCAFM